MSNALSKCVQCFIGFKQFVGIFRLFCSVFITHVTSVSFFGKMHYEISHCNLKEEWLGAQTTITQQKKTSALLLQRNILLQEDAYFIYIYFFFFTYLGIVTKSLSSFEGVAKKVSNLL